MNMNTIQTLTCICIFIELYHVCFYDWARLAYTSVTYKYNWIKAYRKMYNSYFEYSSLYTKQNSEIEYIIPATSELLKIIESLKTIGTPTEVQDKVLKTCSRKELSNFLLQQAIELVYWIISIALIFIMPNYLGLLLFIIITLLGRISQKYPSKILHITDSGICILLFMFVVIFMG